MKPITAEWVGKAEEDYAAARHLSRKRKSPLPGIVCFHCQQCAEKYLKGRLAEAGISFPHTHDLVALLKLVQPAEPLLASLREHVDGLTHYAVDFRYPGESATSGAAKEALVNCRVARKALRKSLGLDEPPSGQIKLQVKEPRATYRVRRRK